MPIKTIISGDDGSVVKQTLKEDCNKSSNGSDINSVISGLSDKEKIVCNGIESAASNVLTSNTIEASSVKELASSPELSFHNDSKYAGDVIEDIPLLQGDSKYKTLPFSLSAQIASTFYEALREQLKDENGDIYSLHPWQLDISKELCTPDKKPTSKHPLKYALVASNGSGKDQFVIAPFALWFIIAKIRSRVIITSSSGTQLTSQTENYIKDLANKINETVGEEVFRIRQRYIFCRWTGSEIRMFATDEEGKAEGYHPLEPGAEMCLIVNEGKSVTEEIHKALGRCSGFNYWLEISSPGEPKGYLYHAFTNWKYSRRVTSYDCPHISTSEIEDDKILYGESSAYFRSKHLALFTSIGGNTIIPIEIVNRLLEHPPLFNLVGSKWVKRIGIDLSLGRDELVFSISLGNKQILEETWREPDTTISADKIHSLLIANGISKTHEYIFADDGGVGHAIIDMLVRKGWNIKRIHNQSPAINKRHYGNRGAEAYDRVKRLFEESLFNPTGMSDTCINQLCNRKIKDKLEGAKMFLQSKKDAKAHGFSSPDRADAFILSLTGLTIEDFLEAAKEDKPLSEGARAINVKLKTPEEVAVYWADKETYKDYETQQQNSGNKRIFGSLQHALGGDSSQDSDSKY